MALDPKIVLTLNTALTHTLTAINQYFLHARILKHKGHMKLADYEYKQSIDAMKHADLLVNRVLALGGLPNLQDVGRLIIGSNVEEILSCDMAMQKLAQLHLQSARAECEAAKDQPSADIVSRMMESASERSKFLAAQSSLLEKLGLDAYLAQAGSENAVPARKADAA